MAKIQLVNVNSNNYFDKNLKVVSLFDKEQNKKTFLDVLFEDSIEFDIYSNQHTDNGIIVTVEGNVRYFTYAKLLDKYYFVAGLKTIFEQGKEKTQLFLDYDLINNSSLTINDLKENSKDNNFFLYRTNIEEVEPTYHNLLRCSSVCENIVSDVEQPKENIYQLTNNWNPHINWKTKTENIGYPILYIKFKADKVPKRGNQSFTYLLEKLAEKFNGAVVSPDYKNSTQQIGSIINNEYTDFVVFVMSFMNIYNLNDSFRFIGDIAETADFIEYIAIDYIDPTFLNSNSLIHVLVLRAGHSPFPMGYILNNEYIDSDTKKVIYNMWGSLDYIPPIKNWDNKYSYNHLYYAHRVPNFFSQRWNKKKFILPYFNIYELQQVIGVDNTFVNVYGKSNTKKDFYERFDNEKICNMSSTKLGLTPKLTDQEKVYNNVLNNGLASIGSSISTAFTILGTTAGTIVGGGLGGPAGAVGGAVVGGAIGSTIGGAVGTYVRGTLSNQWKQRERGLLSIASNENYKKYLNYHLEGNPILPSRYSIDIYESYLTDHQTSIITKDREKFGNYINDYIELELKDKIGLYYLEGNWINFNVGTPDVLLQDKIIEIFNRGVFIHFNPKPFIKSNLEFISSNNDFIITPTNTIINDNENLYLESDNKDIKVDPEHFTYIQDDCLIFVDDYNNIEATVTEGQEHCVIAEKDNIIEQTVPTSTPKLSVRRKTKKKPPKPMKINLSTLNITKLDYYKQTDRGGMYLMFLEKARKQKGFENITIDDLIWDTVTGGRDAVYGSNFLRYVVKVCAKPESKNFEGCLSYTLTTWT